MGITHTAPTIEANSPQGRFAEARRQGAPRTSSEKRARAPKYSVKTVYYQTIWGGFWAKKLAKSREHRTFAVLQKIRRNGSLGRVPRRYNQKHLYG
jgi:hypothetical protein